MFDKLKQLKQIREIQSALEQEVFKEEKEGIMVKVNGTVQVLEIFLNSELSKEKQEEALRECLNSAIKKAQTAMAQRFSSMGGF